MITILCAGAMASAVADTTTATETTAPLSEVTPLSAVEMNWTGITWEPRTYEILTNTPSEESASTVQGRLVLNTSIAPDHILLEDRWELGARTFELTITCRQDSYLSILGTDVGIMHEGSRKSVTMSVEDGRATVKAESADMSMPCPEGTVAETALFRIIPQLPREAGKVYGFGGFSLATDLRITVPAEDQSYRIECAGPESIELNGSEIACTKFSVFTDQQTDYFVDGDSRLRQVVTNDGRITMVLVESATTASAEDDSVQ